jgi:dihydropteroate synthase
MGIVNVTPDSFSGDGLAGSTESAMAWGKTLAEAGVDILDIGGESTRPGAEPVSVDDEIRRTEPVVRGLAGIGVPLSIDTQKAPVAEAALEAGAHLINDVTALTTDPGMADLAARTGAAVCLMHMRGNPATMQNRPEYDDVVAEVAAYLLERKRAAIDAGIAPERILVDPGIGFGKTVDHNLDLINHTDRLRSICGAPVLVGSSRKSFIGKILDRPVEERVFGTGATVAAAIARGADVVRVHDVPAMLDVTRMTDAILRRPRKE